MGDFEGAVCVGAQNVLPTIIVEGTRRTISVSGGGSISYFSSFIFIKGRKVSGHLMADPPPPPSTFLPIGLTNPQEKKEK